MTRVRNANEFRFTYLKACESYERFFRPQFEKLRRRFAEGANATVDQSLEIHLREYKINALLAALNWRLDCPPEVGLPNIFIEVPLESQETEKTRFLDYFGLERETEKPLLVVEAKRPSINLPGLTVASKGQVPSTLSEVVSLGLQGESLSANWSTWLASIRDYVRSIYSKTGEYPKRVMVTNGNWIIVFVDVSDAFGTGGTQDPCRIKVFFNQKEVIDRAAELLSSLEYGNVSGNSGWLTVEEIRFMISTSEVEGFMHGLRLRFHEEVRVYEVRPEINVAPVIFLWSRYGGVIRIHAPGNDYEIPRDYRELSTHIDEVTKAALSLKQDIESRLEMTLEPKPMASSRVEEDLCSDTPAVREPSIDEHVIITGREKHFLLREPSVPECPFHDWESCSKSGLASNSGPILEPSVKPRSFFISGQLHHCAHREVATGKACQITETNREACGLWIGENGAAFCKIWRFETYLCCRACVFEEVCTSADVFCLPCQRSERVTQ